ncbi:TPA: ADP-ribosyltransferase domain-containing protein [Providencia alcalifaciens]
MPTISTQSTQHTSTPLKQSLINQKKTLSNQLKEISNTVESHKSQFSALENGLKKELHLLSELTKISGQYGSDSMVRIKNKQLRGQPSNSFLKNLFFGSRYKSELKSAAEMMQSQKSHVTASECINYFNQIISKDKAEQNSLKQTINTETESLSAIKKELAPIDRQLEKIKSQEVEAQKIATQRKNDCNKFSMIYQSNAGCKAINAQARYLSGASSQATSLSANKVIAEYERVHGSDIFAKGNKDLKSSLKFNSENLSELVKTATKNWYTPSQKTTTSFRGQGITTQGLESLIKQFNADKTTTYKLGQFFSTSTKETVAQSFANGSQDEHKVMFTVKGNSGSGITVSGGLRFDNDESEVLYSPRANFSVTNLTKNSAKNIYNVTLEEVKSQPNAKLLPY